MSTPFKIDYCETCANSSPNLQAKTGRVCKRWNAAVKNSDFCSYHLKELWKCDCCGNRFMDNPIITATYDPSTGATHVDSAICMQCFKNLNKCVTCKNANLCDFETNPSSIPKTIQKEVRQGNMRAVTQVLNPERIAITCQKDCPCWTPDSLCAKQNHGTCPQYQMNRV